jgi:hypothetical protein
MKQKTIYIIATVLLLILSMIGGYKSGISHGSRISVHDTIRQMSVETVRIDKPVYLKSRLLEYRKSVGYSNDSGTRLKDTVYLPYVQKEYASERYKAYVSGYDSRLDSIEIYPQTITIRTGMKPRRLGIGIIGGYGIGKNGFSPYIGLGIYYRIL